MAAESPRLGPKVTVGGPRVGIWPKAITQNIVDNSFGELSYLPALGKHLNGTTIVQSIYSWCAILDENHANSAGFDEMIVPVLICFSFRYL